MLLYAILMIVFIAKPADRGAKKSLCNIILRDYFRESTINHSLFVRAAKVATIFYPALFRKRAFEVTRY
jgi:hypothetical protein